MYGSMSTGYGQEASEDASVIRTGCRAENGTMGVRRLVMKDRVCELECNIDDMTAEELAYAAERLMAAGARDVMVRPIVMKKGRPAYLLTVMCSDDEEEKERYVRLVFKYTTTIGIREVISERYVLGRTGGEAVTPYGMVRYKSVAGYGTKRFKIEYDDLAKIAASEDISIADARDLVMPYVKETAE